MSYRDDIGQAHERIAQLEGELREERAKNAKLAQTVAPRSSPAMKVGVGIALAGAIVGGIFGFIVHRNARSSDAILVKPVDDVVRDQKRYRGLHMRVQGDLVRGTFAKQNQPCEVWMVIEKRSVLLTVHVPHCTLPDTFRPEQDIAISAEGELRDDGVFEAKQIVLPVP